MKELADEVGISDSTYKDWEYGRRIPADILPAIAMALGVPVTDLYGVPKSTIKQRPKPCSPRGSSSIAETLKFHQGLVSELPTQIQKF